MQNEPILVIDDEPSMRHMLRMVLERSGYQVSEAGDGSEALEILKKRRFRLILCDLRMPGMDGMRFIDAFFEAGHEGTLIMMSAYGTLESAIDCMKRGAYDYISKPFQADEILLTLRKAQERLGLREENRALRDVLDQGLGADAVICESPAMKELFSLVGQVSASSHPVLITGETGVGKEVVARTVHRSGVRREGPFVALNCSALSAGILESELFGHLKGAFTGAERASEGLFVAAHGGILFLDEIGELPLELQPKLLRVLQEKELRPVGGTKSRRVDVQILAATARDLHEEVREGRFREDLLYRLNLVELKVPPLREHPEDIEPLANYFLYRAALRDRKTVPRLDAEAIEKLRSYHWPGNVRELRNFMEKTLIFCPAERIGEGDLPWEVRRTERGGDDGLSLKTATERLEREYIAKALNRTGGNRTQAAKLLEISLRALQYKLKDYELED